MVHHVAKVTRGQRVLIHGISGSVGYATMKLCQLQGADVHGTASERNHQAIEDQGGGANAAFNSIGVEGFDESYDILSDTGIVVVFGAYNQSIADEAPTSAVCCLDFGQILGQGKASF
ncbi:putative Zinc-binding dehydrogenase [Seiridium cardinale]|uniref:Zinc-binding dehydrogenase n=1 Tax=Seiridium cardinale TaxID=138064 RepID=A0ABR2Y342_9PEZI